MFTMTSNLQIAHQIQADRRTKADRNRRARRARRSVELDQPAVPTVAATMPNVVLLRTTDRPVADVSLVA
jgi:hypothetical protein